MKVIFYLIGVPFAYFLFRLFWREMNKKHNSDYSWVDIGFIATIACYIIDFFIIIVDNIKSKTPKWL